MISEVYNIDCLEYMATCKDKQFNLAIVDPPYGIDINSNLGLKKGQQKRHKEIKWDSKIPDKVYFIELFRISKNQIIWGGQYFPLGITKCIIWWDKEVADEMSFSSGEMAWTSFNGANKSYKYRNITNDKIHPTQKPVQLYKWLLKNYAKEGDMIFDSHLGSGSSRIACYEGGFDFVGCELDKEYFDASVKRFEIYKSQLKLF
jgi:site-specific DNA-methyltransferase (adenine-specific)